MQARPVHAANTRSSTAGAALSDDDDMTTTTGSSFGSMTPQDAGDANLVSGARKTTVMSRWA